MLSRQRSDRTPFSVPGRRRTRRAAAGEVQAAPYHCRHCVI